jgi:hypothetical protein
LGSAAGEEPPAAVTADTARSKSVNGYDISITGVNALRSPEITLGQHIITATIKRNGAPVTTLFPYIAAFGHVTLINVDTYEFVHAHPKDTTTPAATDRSGPDVPFMPIGLFGTIKPGTYRMFIELNPDDVYTVAPFTVTVQ